jgi:hypothetical protein
MLPAITLLPRQREALARALTDAVCYSDPPVNCDACDMLEDTLCEQCAAMLARARAHVKLGREMGIELPI